MAMVFPTSPVVGQLFSSGGRSWVWNGATWDSPRSDNPPLAIPTGNVIINGGFDIWQRGTSVTNCSEGVYFADRWAPNGYQNNRVSRVAVASGSGPVSQFAIRSATRGTGSRAVITQKIESANAIPFRGRTVTLSFWVRHSAASWTSSSGTSFGAFNYSLGWNTTTTDSSIGTDLWDSNSNSSIAAGSFPTTFTKYTLTATVPSNVNNINVRFTMTGDGTAANDAFWYEVTDVQLEAGAIATPFRRNAPSIQAELAACQRYYFRSGNPSTSNGMVASAGFTFNSGVASCFVHFPVEMRVRPTSIDFSSVSTFRIWTGATGDFTPGSINLGGETSTTIGYVGNNTSGMTAGQFAFMIQRGTGAYIGFSAEL